MLTKYHFKGSITHYWFAESFVKTVKTMATLADSVLSIHTLQRCYDTEISIMQLFKAHSISSFGSHLRNFFLGGGGIFIWILLSRVESFGQLIGRGHYLQEEISESLQRTLDEWRTKDTGQRRITKAHLCLLAQLDRCACKNNSLHVG